MNIDIYLHLFINFYKKINDACNLKVLVEFYEFNYVTEFKYNVVYNNYLSSKITHKL